MGFLLPPPGGRLARMQYFRVSLSVPRCPCVWLRVSRAVCGFPSRGNPSIGFCGCLFLQYYWSLFFPRPRLRETFLPGRVSRPSALARAWRAVCWASAPSRMQPVFRYGDGLGLNAAQERSLWPSALWGSPPAPAHLGHTCLTDCQGGGASVARQVSAVVGLECAGMSFSRIFGKCPEQGSGARERRRRWQAPGPMLSPSTSAGAQDTDDPPAPEALVLSGVGTQSTSHSFSSGHHSVAGPAS